MKRLVLELVDPVGFLFLDLDRFGIATQEPSIKGTSMVCVGLSWLLILAFALVRAPRGGRVRLDGIE